MKPRSDRIVRTIRSKFEVAFRVYGIKPSLALAIVLSPMAIVLLYVFFSLYRHPLTRLIARWAMQESSLVESLTFVFLLLGGVLGLALTWRTRRRGEGPFVTVFYAVFSIGLLFTALEEVAWGQKLLGFGTPFSLEEINAQGELTLHNIRGLQGHSEFFRVAFGLGGLLGVWASSFRRFRKVGTPTLLLPWFSIIVLLAVIDLYNDYIPLFVVNQLMRFAEINEMMIGISGFLFVWLNARMLYPRAKGPPPLSGDALVNAARRDAGSRRTSSSPALWCW